MAASPFRRLHGLFTSSSSLRSKAAKFVTAVAPSTEEPPISRSDHPLKHLVKKFKKDCNSVNFRRCYRVYDNAVRRLAKAKQMSYIEEILEHQKKYDCITNEGFTVRLISLYGKCGMFDHACKLFDEMPELKCKRTVLSFNALLAACVDSKKFDKVQEFFSELPDKLCIKPNTISFNTVINAYCEMGSFEPATLLIKEMEKNGLEPDIISFNTLLEAFYKNNQFSEAEKLWDVIEKKNLEPTVRSYNPRLRALVVDNRVSEAAELFKRMGEKGVKPDVYSYNALIKGYIDEGNLEQTKQIYGEIKEKGCTPDQVTFRMLIPFACDKVNFEFALELSKEAINIGRRVDTSALQRVVDGLVKDLNVDEATELVKLAESCRGFHYKLKLPKDY